MAKIAGYVLGALVGIGIMVLVEQTSPTLEVVEHRLGRIAVVTIMVGIAIVVAIGAT